MPSSVGTLWCRSIAGAPRIHVSVEFRHGALPLFPFWNASSSFGRYQGTVASDVSRFDSGGTALRHYIVSSSSR